MSDVSSEEVPDDSPPAENATGSHLIERVARQHRLTVRRLTPDVLLCESAQQRVVFKGFVGTKVSTVARVLCQHPSWLHRYLVSRGLPARSPTEPRADRLFHVAVVGGEVVAISPATRELPAAANELAVRAINAIPGAAYGSVEIAFYSTRGDDEPVAISGVDPLLLWWTTTEAEDHGTAVAEAVVAAEFDG